MSDTPADRKNPAEAASLPWLSARQLGVIVLLVSMSVLFTATIIGFWFTRLNAPQFRAPGLPDLPGGLALSTLLIVLTSLCIWQAQLAIKKNLLEAVKRWLWSAGALASLFLLTQTANWFAMQPPSSAPSLYLSTFYILTGVHALHVIGGFVPLGFVVHHASKREYSSSRHEGLSLCAQYWHYLGVVWLILVAMLHLGNR
ncbi:MAG: heme-copper oxidase subunit III [Chloroflexales bacterium]|nr:heme-copper oxidase subunit III [Chloroflexales bacterium]